MNRTFALLFVLLTTAPLRGDVTVTRAQDPLQVNSQTIALKLENPRVRVLEATLKPGQRKNSLSSSLRHLCHRRRKSPYARC